MILQDLLQDLTEDRKVFHTKILETSCQELIKNLARFSQDLVRRSFRGLGKTLVRSTGSYPYSS